MYRPNLLMLDRSDKIDATKEELELYKKHLGVDIGSQCSAMVPLMDSIDGNHAKQNVQHKYVPETKKFFSYASKDIPSGTALFGSYGDRERVSRLCVCVCLCLQQCIIIGYTISYITFFTVFSLYLYLWKVDWRFFRKNWSASCFAQCC